MSVRRAAVPEQPAAFATSPPALAEDDLSRLVARVAPMAPHASTREAYEAFSGGRLRHWLLFAQQRLTVDVLKIDRSFVQGIEDDGDAGAIAHAIIVMAHSWRLAVTAEVETPQQLAFLEAHGCDLVQGYFFSAPFPPSKMAAYLQSVGAERNTTVTP